MAKKPTSKPAAEKSVKAAPVAAAPKAKATTTPVRNTAIPKVAAIAAAAAPVAKPQFSYEDIAKRAFEISCGPNCGSETDNWFRAEQELKGL